MTDDDSGGHVSLSGTYTHSSRLPFIQATLFEPDGEARRIHCVGELSKVDYLCPDGPFFFSRRAKFATAGSDLLTDVKAFEACIKLRSEGGTYSALNTFFEEVRPSVHSTELVVC